MSKKNHGGPAFPHSRLGSDHDGMALRDYFAAKAMQAMISAEYAEKLDPLTWSLEAYELADAMIAARELQQ